MTTPTTATHGSIADRFGPLTLAALRIVAGSLFMLHGTQKLFRWPVNAAAEGPAMPPIEIASRAGIAGIIEFGAGLLITLGLFTRPAAFIASGEMAFAYFLAHATRNVFPAFNGGETAVLFCFIFLLISALGPGAASFDALRHRR